MSDDETREALTDRLDEIGALRNITHAPGDDPTTWINAPLSVVLDEVSRVLHAKRGTAPEPPYLDLEPWFYYSERYNSREPGRLHGRFQPRPADEHGRLYSQNREDYEGADRG